MAPMARSLIRPDARELRPRTAAAQAAPGSPPLGALTKDEQAWWDGKEWRLIVGRESPDTSSWWDGKRWKATFWRLPKSYLWILLPLNLVVVGIVGAAIARAFQGQSLPDAIIAIGSSALGGLIGLLVQSPVSASSAPPAKPGPDGVEPVPHPQPMGVVT